MRLGVLLVEEVRIVGADNLYVILPRQLDEHGIDPPLLLIGLLVAVGFVGLVALEFDVIIVAEHAFEPLYCFFRSRPVAVQHFLAQLSAQTCRAGNHALVVHFQQLLVNTRTRIERVVHEPRTGQFAEVVVPQFVLGEQDKVKARLVYLIHYAVRPGILLGGHGVTRAPCAVRLDANDRLEGHKGFGGIMRLSPRLFVLLVDLLAIIYEFLYAVHIAVIGQRDSRHAGADTLINYIGYLRHAVERRVVRVNVQMDKRHNYLRFTIYDLPFTIYDWHYKGSKKIAHLQIFR